MLLVKTTVRQQASRVGPVLKMAQSNEFASL